MPRLAGRPARRTGSRNRDWTSPTGTQKRCPGAGRAPGLQLAEGAGPEERIDEESNAIRHLSSPEELGARVPHLGEEAVAKVPSLGVVLEDREGGRLAEHQGAHHLRVTDRQEQSRVGTVGVAHDVRWAGPESVDEGGEVVGVQAGRVGGSLGTATVRVVVPPAVGDGSVPRRERARLQRPAAGIAEGAVHEHHRFASSALDVGELGSVHVDRAHPVTWRSGHSRASSTWCTGASATLRNCVNPACSKISRIAEGPAWPPSAYPPSCDSAFGVQTKVDMP